MKKSPVFSRWPTALCALAILLSGCFGTSRTARFYTLTPLAAEQTTSHGQGPEKVLTVGLGPILVPPYMDRSQILTRVGPNEVQINEFHRWAGPVSDLIRDILWENLAALLTPGRVVLYPWKGDTPVDCRVEIDIVRFDGIPGDAVTLVARWRLMAARAEEVRVTRMSSIRIPSPGTDFEVLVEAMSRALADLGREIAEAVRTLPAAHGAA